jgi:hypothetical protein
MSAAILALQSGDMAAKCSLTDVSSSILFALTDHLRGIADERAKTRRNNDNWHRKYTQK